MTRKTLSLVAAGLLALGSAVATTHAANRLPSAQPIQVAAMMGISEDGETVTYGPFNTEADANKLANVYNRRFHTYVYRSFFRWYVDVTFSAADHD